ncbi:MAG: hypothetical protein HC933_17375 [Pleurocapsa sp. SU_196_0]|nr:hypothetical protein [Pleurocapsa sp. SU_196_0]
MAPSRLFLIVCLTACGPSPELNPPSPPSAPGVPTGGVPLPGSATPTGQRKWTPASRRRLTLICPRLPSLTLPVTCLPQPGKRDIQVGNATLETGEGITQVQRIGDVNWNQLQPGDTVRIFWKPEAYREKILLSASGTQGAPITVCGVRGPSGELPIISGENATTRADLEFGSYMPIQDLGVITIFNRDYDLRPEFVRVAGLEVRDTLGSGGREQDVHSYTATTGAKRDYSEAAACIRVQEGANITIMGNVITGCGNGLFVLSQIPESRMSRQLHIIGNHLHGNSVVGTDQMHNAYVQGINVVFQLNRFGANRSGAGGANLKMRIAGDVVRYNLLENGARIMDFVEIEEHVALVIPKRFEEFKRDLPSEVQPGDAERVAQAWKAYQQTFVYGNIIRNTGSEAANNIVHYAFDNNQNDRRRGNLYFYNNTIINQTAFKDTSETRLLDSGPWNGSTYDNEALEDNTLAGYATTNAWNNAIVLAAPTDKQDRSYWEFTRFKADKLTLGVNFITTGWDRALWYPVGGFGNRDADVTYPDGNTAHHVSGAQHLITSSEPPLDLETAKPSVGSPLIGAGVPNEPLVAAEMLAGFEIDPRTMRVSARTNPRTLGARD